MCENDESRLTLLDKIEELRATLGDQHEQWSKVTQECLDIANVRAGNPADCCRALLRDLETARRERDEKAAEVAELKERLVDGREQFVDDREFILALPANDFGHSAEWKGKVVATCEPSSYGILPVGKSVFRAYIDDKCGAVSTVLDMLPDPKTAKTQVLQCSWMPLTFSSQEEYELDLVIESLLEEMVVRRNLKESMFPDNVTTMFLRAFSRRLVNGAYQYQASFCVFIF